MNSISVLIASSRRPTLSRTLASVAPQLAPGDELLVDVNADGDWGHEARNRLIDRADWGNWLVHIDDDDVLADDALDTVRRECGEPIPHIFRMRYADGRELWADTELCYGNIGTPMIVAPRDHRTGWFGDEYGGDLTYACTTVEAHGGAVRWCTHVIALVRP